MQAFGAKKYALVGFIWQRAVLIMGLLCIPISVLLLAAEPILLATRQTPEVAAMTASYIRQEACITFGIHTLNPFSLFVPHARLGYLRAAVVCCGVLCCAALRCAVCKAFRTGCIPPPADCHWGRKFMRMNCSTCMRYSCTASTLLP